MAFLLFFLLPCILPEVALAAATTDLASTFDLTFRCCLIWAVYHRNFVNARVARRGCCCRCMFFPSTPPEWQPTGPCMLLCMQRFLLTGAGVETSVFNLVAVAACALTALASGFMQISLIVMSPSPQRLQHVMAPWTSSQWLQYTARAIWFINVCSRTRAGEYHYPSFRVLLC